MERNIRMGDVIRYGIGYCEEGPYARRVIIPSYNSSGQLNYFVARDVFPDSKMKYKNPPTSKNVVMFELLINWNEPIVLCEGVFDAIAIKKNAIPLLGKFPSTELMKTMISNRVKSVYLALDSDAFKNSLRFAESLMNNGVNVHIVELKDSDPSDMGFRSINEKIENTELLSLRKLMEYKLLGV
jgi:DNA primase